MQDKLEKMRLERNNAYWERNQLVAALSKLFPAYMGKHPKDDKEWEDDWRNIVYIVLPPHMIDERHKPFTTVKIVLIKGMGSFEGLQLSWHIHDTDIPMFDHLDFTDDPQWDGHDTQEKYRRLRLLREREGVRP